MAMMTPLFVKRRPFLFAVVLRRGAQDECQDTYIVPSDINQYPISPRALKLVVSQLLLLRSRLDRTAAADAFDPPPLDAVGGAFLAQAKLAGVPPLALEVRPEPRVLDLDRVLPNVRDEAQHQDGAEDAQAARDIKGVLGRRGAAAAGGLDVREDVGLVKRLALSPVASSW